MFEDKTNPKLPQGEENLDVGVYQTINRSGQNKVIAKLAMMPCSKFISWLITNIDIENRLIKNTTGKAIASFQSTSLDVGYKFLGPKVDLTNEWVLHVTLNHHHLLKSQWFPKKRLQS